jgi:hypothetical protein
MKTHNIDTLFLFITKDDLIVGSEPTQNMNKKEAKKMRVEISAALEFKFELFDVQPFNIGPE